jgi:hypothetical protein
MIWSSRRSSGSALSLGANVSMHYSSLMSPPAPARIGQRWVTGVDIGTFPDSTRQGAVTGVQVLVRTSAPSSARPGHRRMLRPPPTRRAFHGSSRQPEIGAADPPRRTPTPLGRAVIEQEVDALYSSERIERPL